MTTIPVNMIAPGHRACAGCGLLVGARMAANQTHGNAVIANATGCLEVTTTAYPQSAWQVPWVHSVFGNAAAVASGVKAALRRRGIDVPVIAQAGDGGTADIGMQALSGMLERGDDVLFVCYDNEGYMNTGVQRSGLTPFDASTTTTPAGNTHLKKDMIAIALAHRAVYVATGTPAVQKDFEKKMERALAMKGPRYLHVLVPCPVGWGYEPRLTIAMSRLAVQTNLFPLVEYVDGALTKAKAAGPPLPVEDYLRPQSRFKHVFAGPEAAEQIARIQAAADDNARRYGLPVFSGAATAGTAAVAG